MLPAQRLHKHTTQQATLRTLTVHERNVTNSNYPITWHSVHPGTNIETMPTTPHKRGTGEHG